MDSNTPNECDVILGRSRVAKNHPGNAMFREIVTRNKVLYASCKKRNDKKRITDSIICALKEIGGRFLDKDADGNWYEIDSKKAFEKVSQALREGRPKIRNQLLEDQNRPQQPDSRPATADSPIPTNISVPDVASAAQPMEVSSEAAVATQQKRTETSETWKKKSAFYNFPPINADPNAVQGLCWPNPSLGTSSESRAQKLLLNEASDPLQARRANSILSCTMDQSSVTNVCDMSLSESIKKRSLRKSHSEDPLMNFSMADHVGSNDIGISESQRISLMSEISNMSALDFSSLTGLEDHLALDDMVVGYNSGTRQLEHAANNTVRDSLLRDDSLIGLVSNSYKSRTSNSSSFGDEYIAVLKNLCKDASNK